MTLCLSHRFPLVFITAASTAWGCFLLLGLVDLNDNRMNALGLVELVYLHLGVCRGPRCMVLVNDQTRHIRTHLRDVNVYHLLLSGDLLILHFLNLLKYLIVHLPLSFSFFEFISLLPLILRGTLVFFLLSCLRPFLFLPRFLLLAVYIHAQCNQPKNH